MNPRRRFVIIGGGIVGLATAYRLTRAAAADVVVVEKEKDVAAHQTGHNSGVIHSGIYYRPGSLKASTCRTGKALMERFCGQEGIPFERCGKVIVATNERELVALQRLFERGRANGVDCELIEAEALAAIEPHARGLRAIHVREAGIVDYRRVCERLRARITEAGGRVITGARVAAVRESAGEIVAVTDGGEFAADYAINCAGLHSDRVARLAGDNPDVKIIPFRGEYFKLKPHARHLCRTMIYPVPDDRFPFLGVHCTKRIDGSVECGPNAVLAFAREGYGKMDINLRDLAETLGFAGFRRMARRYWRTGAAEMWRSFSKAAFVAGLRRLVPDITAADLEPAPAGVRAQAVTAEGTLVDDFVLVERRRHLNVVNAPSPAATASFSIAEAVVQKALAAL